MNDGPDPGVSVEIDQARAWELYCALAGDCAQVAAALGGRVEERDVTLVASRFGWPVRYRALAASPDSLVSVTRARNGAQALRLQRVLDKVLDSIESGGDDAIKEWTTTVLKDVPNRTGGPLMQLSAAVETTQKLIYRAIGDTGEPNKGKGGAGEGSLLVEMNRAFEASAKALGQSPGELAKSVVG